MENSCKFTTCLKKYLTIPGVRENVSTLIVPSLECQDARILEDRTDLDSIFEPNVVVPTVMRPNFLNKLTHVVEGE